MLDKLKSIGRQVEEALHSKQHRKRTRGMDDEEERQYYLLESIEHFYHNEIHPEVFDRNIPEVEDDIIELTEKIEQGRSEAPGINHKIETDRREVAEIVFAIAFFHAYKHFDETERVLISGNTNYEKYHSLPTRQYEKFYSYFGVAHQIAEDFGLEDEEKIAEDIMKLCEERYREMEELEDKFDSWSDEKIKAEIDAFQKRAKREDEEIRNEAKDLRDAMRENLSDLAYRNYHS